MPADQFQRDALLTADRTSCWEALTDVKRLVGWITVLSEADEQEHMSRYGAVLTDRIGPFSLRADLDITITDVDEPNAITVRAEGRDRQVDSRIFVEGTLRLEPADGGCRLRIEGRYEVTGKVAMFGGPMIRAKADKILNDFVDGVTGELG